MALNFGSGRVNKDNVLFAYEGERGVHLVLKEPMESEPNVWQDNHVHECTPEAAARMIMYLKFSGVVIKDMRAFVDPKLEDLPQDVRGRFMHLRATAKYEEAPLWLRIKMAWEVGVPL